MKKERVIAILALLPRAISGAAGGVWGVIKNIPVYILLAKELVLFWAEFKAEVEAEKKLAAMKEALKYARETGDPSKVTELFNGRKHASPDA